MKNCIKNILIITILACAVSGPVCAAENVGTTLAALSEVQKYERAIHILAMLLIGFGFLMVFVKK